jgi:hypothetical protein
VRRELNVLALVKGAERYVYVFDDLSRATLIDAIRDQAAEPRLSLNWFDAAVLTEKARSIDLPTTTRPNPATPDSHP